MATTKSTLRSFRLAPNSLTSAGGIRIIILVAALFLLWWLWYTASVTDTVKSAEQSIANSNKEYVRTIALVPHARAITLPLSNPFKGGRWIYTSSKRPLPANYMPQNLTPVTLPAAPTDTEIKLQLDAKKGLEQLFATADTEEYPLIITSAYRSAEYQQKLLDNYVAKDGEALANEYVEKPGASEHQTGLAVDVAYRTTACQADIEKCSVGPLTADWLAANAPKYGFIIRYPDDKQAITGKGYEPWHLRYIGKDAATLAASGLSFEEFVQKVEPGYIQL